MSIPKTMVVAAVALFAVVLTTPAHANPASDDAPSARVAQAGTKPQQAKPAAKPATQQQAKPAAQKQTTAKKAAAAPRVAFGYGVQVHAPDGNQQVIDMTKGMGFNWIKQQVEWFRYEPNKGEYHFEGLDNLVNQANAAGINVLLSVVKAPEWARGGQDMSVAGPPNNPQDYADFIGAMAAHFKAGSRPTRSGTSRTCTTSGAIRPSTPAATWPCCAPRTARSRPRTAAPRWSAAPSRPPA
jgi:hypothetical protein